VRSDGAEHRGGGTEPEGQATGIKRTREGQRGERTATANRTKEGAKKKTGGREASGRAKAK